MGRKAKFVQVTPENIKQIYGRLRKFFAHKRISATSVYDCGNTKRFNGSFRRMHRNFKIDVFDFFTVEGEDIIKKPCISVSYTSEDSMMRWGITIHMGDGVAFCGNRIVVKQKLSRCLYTHNYEYVCYQIEKPVQKSKPCIEYHEYEIELAPGITRRYVRPAGWC